MVSASVYRTKKEAQRPEGKQLIAFFEKSFKFKVIIQDLFYDFFSYAVDWKS